jgi:ABC-2 type transport system permease protein
MTNQEKWIAFLTILIREIRRFVRIWQQTLLPPAITITLYFVIFGALIGPRIGQMSGFSYIEFVAPGLIMMSVITNSYGNVVSSFYGAKFGKSVEELLVSPVPNYIILIGFIMGGVARGLGVGMIVTLLSLFFTKLHVQNLGITVSIIFLTSVLFSLAGFINAVFAKSFDDISIIPTFVLTPLTYLGGVFYSVSMLPAFWQGVSHANPILYMINAFRFGMLGVSDIPVVWAFVMIFLFIVALYMYSLYLLRTSKGLRS